MSRWQRRLGFMLTLVVAIPTSAQSPAPTAVPTFAEPGISPDHSEIAFASGGDIWTVPVTGGVARRLVSHPANETRPLYSPDGKRLAFISTRTGGGDIYVLTFASGDLKRLTFDDALDQLDAWSPDGKWVYFSSSSREIAGMNDVFRVSVDGGTPMAVSGDRYTNDASVCGSRNPAGFEKLRTALKMHYHIRGQTAGSVGEAQAAQIVAEKGLTQISTVGKVHSKVVKISSLPQPA